MDQVQTTLPKSRWRLWLSLVIISMVVIVAVILRFTRQTDPTPAAGFTPSATPAVSDGSATLVREGSPTLGPANAPITIVEFSDFGCPFSEQSFPAVRTLALRYPEAVRIVYRHFPITSLHPDALLAAEASACANAQGKFWAYHDRLFQNQSALAKADLLRYGNQVGLNEAEFTSCLDTRAMKAFVEEDIAQAVRLGVRGTPTWFINGEKVEGAITLDAFVGAIERLLGK